MSNTEQLERETEQTRAQLADTLDELRACMTPGHVLDQLSDRMSDGAAATLARNLKDQAVNNPLPIALMGASLVWLMVGPRRGAAADITRRSADRIRGAADRSASDVRDAAESARETAADKSGQWRESASRLRREATESVRSTADSARQAIDETGQGVRDTAGTIADSARKAATESADSMREAADSTANSMQHTASTGYDAVADSARRTAASISESTKAAGEQTLRKGNMLLEFCREQPLLLAGLGIAVGALVGALLPSTEAENRVMGETSDRVKEGAQELASEQYESAKTVGERALEATQDEASKEQEALEPHLKTGSVSEWDEPTLAPTGPASPEREARGQLETGGNAPT